MKEYRLGDIITIKHGYAFDGEHIVQEDNGIVLVTPGNFRIGGGFQEEKCKFYSGEIPDGYVLSSGDFIVTMTDLSKTIDTLGYSALVPESDNRVYLHNQRIGLVSFKANDCFPGYIYFLMRTHPYQRFIANTSTGSTVHHTSPSKIYDYRFYAPSYEEQREIAERMFAYEKIIKNNQRQIKLLEEAAQRLYKEWFVDLRFPGHENTKITDGIPEGWHKTTLAEIAVIIKRGISPKYAADGKYTVINQKCIRGSIMDITESRKQEKQYEPILNIQDCDTVICSTGTGTLGRVGQIYGDYPNTTFDSHVTLVRAKENPNFMYQAIKNQQRFLMGMGHGSTNQQELYRNVIENVEVLLPDGSFLLQTEKLLSTFHDKIKTVYLQTSILTETRDRLLPKLMSGEIEHIS